MATSALWHISLRLILQNVNLLLLDKETEKLIESYVFNSAKDSYSDFRADVSHKINVNDYISQMTNAYLSDLEVMINSKKVRFIEVEINRVENKVIIKDNLDHSNFDITNYKLNSTSSYSPALGFNRLCLEGE